MLLLVALSAIACSKKKRPPAPGGDGDAVRPPDADLKGCLSSLTGEWHAQQDARYRYRIEDRGKLIRVYSLLDEVPDGGHPSHDYVYEIARYPLEDPGSPRWPMGVLRFIAEAPDALTPDGGTRKMCQIELAARITGCWKQSIVLASKVNGKMNWQTCVVEETAQWNETPLVR